MESTKLDISSLAIRIIFLLLPGAIASTLYWKLKGRSSRKDWEDILEIIIFSLFSYLLYAICSYVLSFGNAVWYAFGLRARTFSHFRAFFDEKASVDLWEIFYASLLSVTLALLAAYSYQYKWLNKIGQKIGATTRFGDEDVWDFVQHSPAVRGQWVTIRDHKLKLNYSCWIQHFSDTDKERELLLREVSVYNDPTGEFLYKADVMYISRKNDQLTIEAAITSPDMLDKELKLNGNANDKPSNETASGENKEA
jgi:hypothetical protein